VRERPNPDDFYRPFNDWESPPEYGASSDPVKLYDGEFRYRGTWDKTPEGTCRVRLFSRGNETPVLVLSELPDNPSTSVTNLAEVLFAEAIRHFCPERFGWAEPVVAVEHYVEEHDRRGKVARKATWDRVTFASWTPRKIWLGGRERISLGAPTWRSMPREEVVALIGEGEAEG
jgi:hypothetical protein